MEETVRDETVRRKTNSRGKEGKTSIAGSPGSCLMKRPQMDKGRDTTKDIERRKSLLGNGGGDGDGDGSGDGGFG
ncbi:hypothetical protein M0802_004808 [Mischocyttarus mexicanus]|nr:hypothetical protein M0802_004808 [Mischocyttarus mexicanus]